MPLARARSPSFLFKYGESWLRRVSLPSCRLHDALSETEGHALKKQKPVEKQEEILIYLSVCQLEACCRAGKSLFTH